MIISKLKSTGLFPDETRVDSLQNRLFPRHVLLQTEDFLRKASIHLRDGLLCRFARGRESVRELWTFLANKLCNCSPSVLTGGNEQAFLASICERWSFQREDVGKCYIFDVDGATDAEVWPDTLIVITASDQGVREERRPE